MADITITFDEVLSDLKSINKEEVRSIGDPKARYFAEAGTEKLQDITRCIREAMSQAVSPFARFLTVDFGNGTTITISLTVSDRRIEGKQQAVEDTFHSLIVNHAMSKYYNDVQLPDLATKRASLAAEDVKLLSKLLYEKHAPVYPTLP